MKTKIKHLIFCIIIFQCNGFCQINSKLDSLQKLNFDESDIVFLGEIINFDTINSLTSKIKVFEVLKGDSLDFITIKYKGENSILPITDGLWLIYAKKLDDEYYYIRRFGISRSNIDPERINYYVPEFPKNKKEEKYLETQLANIRMTAIVDWFNELYKLRYYSKRNINGKFGVN